MNKRLKTKWVKALRSGKYTQATGQLVEVQEDAIGQKYMAYCCLGVLREIEPGIRKMRNCELLSPNGCGIDHETQNLLGSKNDCGESFDSIANYIEKHL